MQQPTRLISTPFAQEGEKTEIQNVTGEFDNSATYRLGFPPLTMQSIRSGGKPPKGTDFNGVLFDITENISFLCKGGRYQYNAGLSTLIGGYPKGSNLLLDDNVTEVVSTVNGNVNNPNSNMTGWGYSSLTPSNNLSDVADKAKARTNLGVYSKAETDNIATTPSATEAIVGKARIATQSETIAGTNDETIITPKKLKDISFGRTGGYANVTASRSANTVYTNPKNTPLVVAITAGAQDSTALNKTSIISGGLEAVYASISSGSMISTQIVIIPSLAQYRLNNPLSIVKWMEW